LREKRREDLRGTIVTGGGGGEQGKNNEVDVYGLDGNLIQPLLKLGFCGGLIGGADGGKSLGDRERERNQKRNNKRKS